MSHDPHTTSSPLFHFDSSADAISGKTHRPERGDEANELLRQLVAGQKRQNELLAELTQQINSTQKQRANELGQWKQANPRLARQCRTAAEVLSHVQTQFLETITEEITDNGDGLLEGEFLLNEFVDRFGPRLAHLNGVLQVLSQLSSVPNPANTPQQ